MNKLEILKKAALALRNGCVIFSVITLAGFSVLPLFDINTLPFDLGQIWLVFLFSVVLAGANLILSLKGFKTAIKLLIHFVSCAVLYFAVMVLFWGRIGDGKQTMVAMALFLFVYIIFAVIYLIAKSTKKKKKNKKENYDSMFR